MKTSDAPRSSRPHSSPKFERYLSWSYPLKAPPSLDPYLNSVTLPRPVYSPAVTASPPESWWMSYDGIQDGTIFLASMICFLQSDNNSYIWTLMYHCQWLLGKWTVLILQGILSSDHSDHWKWHQDHQATCACKRLLWSLLLRYQSKSSCKRKFVLEHTVNPD